MTHQLRLMAILAHPDDESLGYGGTFAKYSREGIETYLLTATRGERGRFGNENESPGLEIVGKKREEELLSAGEILGIKKVHFLDYMDGELDQANPSEIIHKIAGFIRKIRPQVIFTFDPAGAYGHPDHIAISQFAAAGIVGAANPEIFTHVHEAPHAVSKFYYGAWSQEKWDIYQSAFKELVSHVDGVRRAARPWPEWNITTRIDSTIHWETVWKAVLCHHTQLAVYQKLEKLSESDHKALWGSQDFYRVFSTVNGGRKIETDLFEGLR